MLTILIGNSDDKLSQAKWSMYVTRVQNLVRNHATQIHFHGFPNADLPWQNAAWVIKIHERNIETLIEQLTLIRKDYDQDSVAIVRGETEFI